MAKEKSAEDAALVSTWLNEIKIAENWREKWRERAQKVLKAYRDERDQIRENSCKKVNIYWSSVRTIQPQIFSSIPKSRIKRRYSDNDKTKRLSAEILQRGTQYSLSEHQDLEEVGGLLRDDFLIIGRGVTWERFEPKKEKSTKKVPVLPEELQSGESAALKRKFTPDEVTTEGEESYLNVETEDVVSQKTITDYVYWDDFLHNPARTNAEIRWKGRRHFLTKSECAEKFGKDIGQEITLTKEPEGLDSLKLDKEDQEEFKKAEVWEIWNLPKREVLYISPGYKHGPLKHSEDPLGLRGFFPCPAALTDFTTSESLLPIPEYCMAQDQVEEVNKLTERIDAMVDSIRNNALSPKALAGELEKLFQGDNKIIPCEQFDELIRANGIQGLQWAPIQQAVAALQVLTQMRNEALQLYYEVTHQADITRGASDPNETATAQGIKEQFVGIVVKQKRRAFQRYMRDVIRIKAEIISQHFEPEQLQAMVGLTGFFEPITQQDFDAAIQLLKDDVLRDYAIDIESDSTIVADDQNEQQNLNELMSVVTPFINQMVSAIQQMPALAPTLTEILMMVIRGFESGERVEEVIEQNLKAVVQQQMQAAQAAAQAGPQQDPVAMANMQIAQAELQKVQVTAQKNQMDFQSEREKLQSEYQQKMTALQIEQQQKQAELNLKMAELQIKQKELEIKSRELAIKEAQLGLDRDKAVADFQYKGMELQARQSMPAEKPEPAPEKPSKGSEQPIHVHVNMPSGGSKVVRLATAPDGSKIGTVEEVPAL